jgi:pimeloyl-ACP methyl ester carboxylesterase
MSPQPKMPQTFSPLLQAVGVQAPYEQLAVNNTQMAVARRGKGSPIICLHATGHGGRDYETFAKNMSSENFEVISVDWPGHGASPDATNQTASAKRYAVLLADLIPALNLSARPILLGNSIGGAAALEFALDHPEKLRALVLCNPGGLAPLNVLAKLVIAGMVAFFGAGARGKRWFAPAFAAYYRLVLPGTPAIEQRARIIAAGPEVTPLLKQAWDSFRQPEADLRARAKSLKVPVLFAWAKQDQIVAWSRSQAAVRAIPNAKVVFFRGGHSAFLEDPEAFKAAFLAFTRDVGRDPHHAC